jgi:hypothetical protein
MRVRAAPIAGMLLSAGGVALLLSPAAGAAENAPRVSVLREVHHDVSPRLRDMKPVPPPVGEHEEEPVRPLPVHLPPKGQRGDGALQREVPGKLNTVDLLNFAGVGTGDYGFQPPGAPPDTNGAVGATQYLQWVNDSFAVFDKTTGAKLFGPVTGKTLWQGFGGSCETNNDGDIIAQYDKIAKRWVMAQFSIKQTPYLECVAVSQTSDATGAWNRYAFDYGNSDFPDYPKIGVWPDAYYATYNIFHGKLFGGAKLCALDRLSMIDGKMATQQCYQLSAQYGGVLPADLDGATLPPAGAPDYLLNFGVNRLNLWKFHVDFINPANTRLTGPAAIAVASFSPVCGGRTCLPQKNTSQQLDSIADRLMYRLAYRNFGDHESLVVNHSIASKARAGVRWYELRDPGGTPTVFQQGTYVPGKTLWYWMGSAAMDKIGDLAIGFSTTSSDDFPSIGYAGRLPGDRPGTLRKHALTFRGSGSQINGLSRWGDYSAMSIDPADDCTFYFTSEYLKTTGAFNWSTRVNSFRFPGCQ